MRTLMIDAVKTVLRVLLQTTGLRLAVVARVTAESWTCCAVWHLSDSHGSSMLSQVSSVRILHRATQCWMDWGSRFSRLRAETGR
jgi:hypothetical protein